MKWQSQKVFPQEDVVRDEALKKEIDNVGMIDYVSQHEVVVGSIHLKTEPIANEGLSSDCDLYVPHLTDTVQDTPQQYLLNGASEGLLPDKDQTSSLHGVVTHQTLEHDLLNSVSETSEGLLPDKDQTLNVSSSQEMLTKCFVFLQQLTMLDLEPISLHKCSVNLEPLSVKDMQKSSLHKCLVKLQSLSVKDVQQTISKSYVKTQKLPLGNMSLQIHLGSVFPRGNINQWVTLASYTTI